jgi:RNA polymerase sigma factor (sigma-70 family)
MVPSPVRIAVVVFSMTAPRPGDRIAAGEVDGWQCDYATSRDPVVRERIILAYLGLADRLADRYRQSRGTTPEDLRQTARAGLIAAIDRYDPNYSNPFVPYAVACVVGEVKRYLRDTSWRLHVPRTLKEQAMQVCKTVDQLQQTLGRSPTTAELAERLQVAEEEVLEALAVAQSRQELSLDRPVGDDTATCLGDLVASPAAREETEDHRAHPTLHHRRGGAGQASRPKPWHAGWSSRRSRTAPRRSPRSGTPCTWPDRACSA